MLIRFSILLILSLSPISLMSQADCVLGVGITENETIADIFQMNDSQKEQLANLGAELKYRNELLNNRLENLYNRHPQSTVEELNQLALKYRSVMDSMELVQSMIDKKVLSLFNQKQYDLYLSLCQQASRSPHIITPMVYADSVYKKQ